MPHLTVTSSALKGHAILSHGKVLCCQILHHFLPRIIDTGQLKWYVIYNEVNIMDSIYTYFDYRQYLNDLVQEMRRRNKMLSLRAIAARIGINSGTLVRILNNERNISKKLIPAFASFLRLKNKESLYFSILVEFNQARDNEKRRNLYDQLIMFRNEYRKPVNPDAYEFYEQWYYTVIRELLHFFPFTDDFEGLAKMVQPEITANQAKKAVAVLQRIGFIKKTEDGCFKPDQGFITTGKTWRSVAIEIFQKTMMENGVTALDRFPREKRDFSTMTMRFSDEGYKKVRQILKRTREEIAHIEEEDKAANQVFQINMQLFPVSKEYTAQGC
jgi:uncharacterized protein (TIGR02147 family)